jgi:hypothetical protein
VGFNELGPVNTNEILIMTMMLLGSAIINAQIFGQIAMTVSIMQDGGVQEQMNLDRDYNVMTHLELPDHT